MALIPSPVAARTERRQLSGSTTTRSCAAGGESAIRHAATNTGAGGIEDQWASDLEFGPQYPGVTKPHWRNPMPCDDRDGYARRLFGNLLTVSREDHMRTKAAIWITILLILTVGGTVVAATTFSDVNQIHPQYRDIEFAVEEGWFQGYEDGTYRPDQAITHEQIGIVIKRAFPEGATRADMATFLRGGAERLAALPTSSSGCGSSTFESPANPGCPGISGDWTFVVHSANPSTWGRFADQEEGFMPVTLTITARYDGDSNVGYTYVVTVFELFVGGAGYRVDGIECADDDYGDAPNLLAGNEAQFKVCFALPETSAGSGALLQAKSWTSDPSWHSVVIP